MILCPECGVPSPEGTEKCLNCGHPFTEPGNNPVSVPEDRAALIDTVKKQRKMASINALLKQAHSLIENNKFNDAAVYCNKVLEIDPKNTEAHIARLLIELKVHKLDEIVQQNILLSENTFYQAAFNVADSDLKITLQEYSDQNRAYIETEQKNQIYATAIQKSKSKRPEDLQEALKLFTSIVKWKDSAEQIVLCQEKLNLVEVELQTKKEKGFKLEQVGKIPSVILQEHHSNNVLPISEPVKPAQTTESASELLADIDRQSKMASISALLSQANSLVESNKFHEAGLYYDKILDIDPNHTQAHIAQLLVELKVHKLDEIVHQDILLCENATYQNLLDFVDDDLKDLLQEYGEQNRIHVETEQKNKIYSAAIQKSESRKPKELREAIDLFKSILEWNDSANQVIRCEEKLNLLEVELALNKEKNKRTSRIAVAIVLLAIAIGSIGTGAYYGLVAKPKQDFEAAYNLLMNGQVSEACMKLQSLKSEEELQEILYQAATQLVEQKRYDSAIQVINKLPNREAAQGLEKKANYTLGKQYFDGKDYKKAEPYLRKAGNYKDAASLLAQVTEKLNPPKNNNASTSVTYSVEIDGKKYQANSQEEINNIIQQNIYQSILGNKTPEPALPANALLIEGCSGAYSGSNFEYSFIVKNNINLNFTSIGLNCSLLDAEDNIIDTDVVWLHATIPSGKKATVTGSLRNLNSNIKKIAVDYITYDTNGDNHCSTYHFTSDVVQANMIDVPAL